MNYLRIIPFFSLLGALACSLLPASREPLTSKEGTLRAILLQDPAAMGDSNQLLGLSDALQGLLGKRFHWDTHQIQDKPSPQTLEPLTGETRLFLLSGRSGLQWYQKHLSLLQESKVKVAWSGHQFFEELSTFTELPELIFLPAYALNETQRQLLNKKSRVYLLSTVPHRVTPERVEQAKEELTKAKSSLLLPSAQNLLVILPGDAPDPQGQMRFFTPDDARALAQRIVAKEGKSRHYLITNGPRTGSFDYQLKVKLEPNPHRSGHTDKVTEAFISEMAALGVKKTDLFDFQFDKVPNPYLALLGFIRWGGKVHVAGESSSMISECTDLGLEVVIDLVPSMNPIHRAQAQQLYQTGRASLLQENGEFLARPSSIEPQAKLASIEAAEAILIWLGLKR